MLTNLIVSLAAYCHCQRCTGTSQKPTASNRWPEVGISIAAPRRIPFGTWVRFDKVGWRRVDDRTRKDIDGWDEFVGSKKGDHQKAARLGIRTVRILEIRPSDKPRPNKKKPTDS